MGSGVSLIRKPKAKNGEEQKTTDASPISATANVVEPFDSPRSGISDVEEAMRAMHLPQASPVAESPRLDLHRRFSHRSNPPSSSPSPDRESLQSFTTPRRSSRSRSSRAMSSPVDMEQQGAIAEVFAHTAMSLGLDNDDLLFNMMYFDDGHAGTFGNIMNTVQQETLALHSEHNTPYKLNPATQEAVSGLIQETYRVRSGCSDEDHDKECAVCRDEFELDCIILRLPTCKHFFHESCILKWSSLQGWCPVCRTPLASTNISHEIHPDAQAQIQSLRQADGEVC
eukprot:gene33186-40152_t